MHVKCVWYNAGVFCREERTYKGLELMLNKNAKWAQFAIRKKAQFPLEKNMKNKMQSAMIKLSHSLCSFFQIFSFCVLFSLIQKRLYTVMKDTTVLNVSISDVSACQISFVILFLFCCRTRGSLSFHWSRERLRKPQNGTQIDLLSDMPGQIHHRKRFFGGFI